MEPTCNIIECGTKFWHINGFLHRQDGPAIELANGDKEWWLNDKRHRQDGPAIEFVNGEKQWYLNGNFIKRQTIKTELNWQKEGL